MAYRRYRKWRVKEKVPMRKFGYQGVEVTGHRRKLHNVELYNLYTSPIEGTALQTRRLQVRFPIASLEFFIDIILSAALWPWGQLIL